MKDFKKLQIWQMGMDITDQVFTMYEELPYNKVSELKGQAIRSAISIPSNIAEGNSRRSEKEKLRYMEIALGSSFELETQTLILLRRGVAVEEKVQALLKLISSQQAMLVSFMQKLKP